MCWWCFAKGQFRSAFTKRHRRYRKCVRSEPLTHILFLRTSRFGHRIMGQMFCWRNWGIKFKSPSSIFKRTVVRQCLPGEESTSTLCVRLVDQTEAECSRCLLSPNLSCIVYKPHCDQYMSWQSNYLHSVGTERSLRALLLLRRAQCHTFTYEMHCRALSAWIIAFAWSMRVHLQPGV